MVKILIQLIELIIILYDNPIEYEIFIFIMEPNYKVSFFAMQHIFIFK
jgi:hypothetical protein